MPIEGIEILIDDEEPREPRKHSAGCRRGELCKCKIKEGPKT